MNKYEKIVVINKRNGQEIEDAALERWASGLDLNAPFPEAKKFSVVFLRDVLCTITVGSPFLLKLS